MKSHFNIHLLDASGRDQDQITLECSVRPLWHTVYPQIQLLRQTESTKWHTDRCSMREINFQVNFSRSFPFCPLILYFRRVTMISGLSSTVLVALVALSVSFAKSKLCRVNKEMPTYRGFIRSETYTWPCTSYVHLSILSPCTVHVGVSSFSSSAQSSPTNLRLISPLFVSTIVSKVYRPCLNGVWMFSFNHTEVTP